MHAPFSQTVLAGQSMSPHPPPPPPPVQVPPSQRCPWPQTLPQVPQLLKSVRGSIQLPLHLRLPPLQRFLRLASVVGAASPPTATTVAASVARNARRVGTGAAVRPKPRVRGQGIEARRVHDGPPESATTTGAMCPVVTPERRQPVERRSRLACSLGLPAPMRIGKITHLQRTHGTIGPRFLVDHKGCIGAGAKSAQSRAHLGVARVG